MFTQTNPKPLLQSLTNRKNCFFIYMRDAQKRFDLNMKPIKIDLNITPNLRYTSNTWDVRHLDKFLKKIRGKTLPELTFDDNMNESKVDNSNTKDVNQLKGISSMLQKNSKSLEKSKNSLANSEKESFYFRNQPRLDPSELKHKMIKFDTTYSSSNILAQNIKTLNKEIIIEKDDKIKIFENKFDQMKNKKLFDLSNLSPADDNSLLTSKERMSNVRNVKIAQREYKEWKKNLNLLNKQNRIIKNEYRSGILNIDNPLLDDTFYYKAESENLKSLKSRQEKKNENHRNFIDEHRRTNDQISFFNKNAKQRKSEFINFPDIYDSAKKRNISDFWQGRKKIETSQHQTPTHTNLFGSTNEKTYYGRAKYLLEEDCKGKDWYIIGNVKREDVLKVGNFKLNLKK